MKVIEVKEILVEDDVYAALEREAKELSISAAKCARPFEVTISHVVDMAVHVYGQGLIEKQKKADALAYTE